MDWILILRLFRSSFFFAIANFAGRAFVHFVFLYFFSFECVCSLHSLWQFSVKFIRRVERWKMHLSTDLFVFLVKEILAIFCPCKNVQETESGARIWHLLELRKKPLNLIHLFSTYIYFSCVRQVMRREGIAYIEAQIHGHGDNGYHLSACRTAKPWCLGKSGKPVQIPCNKIWWNCGACWQIHGALCTWAGDSIMTKLWVSGNFRPDWQIVLRRGLTPQRMCFRIFGFGGLF